MIWTSVGVLIALPDPRDHNNLPRLVDLEQHTKRPDAKAVILPVDQRLDANYLRPSRQVLDCIENENTDTARFELLQLLKRGRGSFDAHI